MRRTVVGWLIVIAGAAGLIAQTPQTGRTANAAADWPTYNRDLAGTRFSPLTQINTENVSRLVQTWTYRIRPEGPPSPFGGSEATPIVLNGVMYLPATNRVVALEADTGKEIWQDEVTGGGQVSRRGVSYWPGEGTEPARILFMTGQRLIALNAATGDLSSGFGKDGIVDTVVPYNSAPTIFKNVVMIGANVNEVPIGPPGDTRAYDARTGKKLWDFHTVPRAGELGNNTWGDGWKGRSGTNIWGFSMTVDEQRGIVYMPVSGPAANYWGGDRPGNNLFANSVVAVDAQSGKYKWHFQTVHHDIWDSDMPSAPGLVDIVQNGRTIPALASVGKTGYMFILDRTNGKPIFGVEERPVPKGDVPGEWYSPTQPFPLKPPPLSKVSFKKEDMVTEADTTAEHVRGVSGALGQERRVRKCWALHAVPFPRGWRPAEIDDSVSWRNRRRELGRNRHRSASGYVFLNSHDTSLVGWVEKRKPGVEYQLRYPRARRLRTIERALTDRGLSTPSLRRSRTQAARRLRTSRANGRHGLA